MVVKAETESTKPYRLVLPALLIVPSRVGNLGPAQATPGDLELVAFSEADLQTEGLLDAKVEQAKNSAQRLARQLIEVASLQEPNRIEFQERLAASLGRTSTLPEVEWQTTYVWLVAEPQTDKAALVD